ncbi:MAG TPA: surface-adhesin E family protein [Gemmatimonadaceae bacterium]|nr:surface-adhesin E family protein [Gemmatimonadaceae bacterium]
MIRSRPVHLALVATLAVSAAWSCKGASVTRDWVRVAADTNYTIALDRLHISEWEHAPVGGWDQAFEIWYRTDHTQPRLHNGDPFDREIVRAIILCDRFWFKVVSVDMVMGDSRVVARQRASDEELNRQAWRPVARGTTEEVAAVAACDMGRQATEHVAEAARKP